MINPFKKVAKKAVSKASEKFVRGVKDKAKDAVSEVKEKIIDGANDILPYLVVGGVILIGICLARRQPPITVKVVIKQV